MRLQQNACKSACAAPGASRAREAECERTATMRDDGMYQQRTENAGLELLGVAPHGAVLDLQGQD